MLNKDIELDHVLGITNRFRNQYYKDTIFIVVFNELLFTLQGQTIGQTDSNEILYKIAEFSKSNPLTITYVNLLHPAYREFKSKQAS